MDYLSWNKIVGEEFFNDTKRDSHVILFISRKDIIELGKRNIKLSASSDDHIWRDFIDALRNGCDGKVDNTCLIETLEIISNYYHRELKSKRIHPCTVPYYFLYLAAIIVSMSAEDALRSNFETINRFFTGNKISVLKPQNRQRNWNKYWEGLQAWSMISNKRRFITPTVRNKDWVYMGKPLSQLIINPLINKITPECFRKEKWHKGQLIDDSTWDGFVAKYSDQLFSKRISLNGILSDKELTEFIKPFLTAIYERWNGPEVRVYRRGTETASSELLLGFSPDTDRVYFRIHTNSRPQSPFQINGKTYKMVNDNYSEEIDVNVFIPYLPKNETTPQIKIDYHSFLFKKKDFVVLKHEYSEQLKRNQWIQSTRLTEEASYYILLSSQILMQLDPRTQSEAVSTDLFKSLHPEIGFYLKTDYTSLTKFIPLDETLSTLKLTGGWKLQRYHYVLHKPPYIIVSPSDNSRPSVSINKKVFSLKSFEMDGHQVYALPKAAIKEIKKTNPHSCEIKSDNSYVLKLGFTRLSNIKMNQSLPVPGAGFDSAITSVNQFLQDTNYRNSLMNRFFENHSKFIVSKDSESTYNFIQRHNANPWGSMLIWLSFNESLKNPDESILKKSVFKYYLKQLDFLGHVYFHCRKLYLERPFAYEVPGYSFPGFYTAILAGMRDIEFLQNIHSASQQYKVIIKMDNANQVSLNRGTGHKKRILHAEPPRIAFLYENRDDFKKFCEDCQIRFDAKINYSFMQINKEKTLMKFLESLIPSYFQVDSENTKYYDFQSWVYVPRKVETINDTRLVQLLVNNKRRYFLEIKGLLYYSETFYDDFEAWAMLSILNSFGVRDVFKLDYATHTLSVSNLRIIPRFLFKALTLNEGFSVYSLKNLQVTFENIDHFMIKEVLVNNLSFGNK